MVALHYGGEILRGICVQALLLTHCGYATTNEKPLPQHSRGCRPGKQEEGASS